MQKQDTKVKRKLGNGYINMRQGKNFKAKKMTNDKGVILHY